MRTLTVVNTGRRARHRLGRKFLPGVEVEVEVTKSGERAILATRDLSIVTDEPAGDAQAGEYDISAMTVKAVLAAVAAGDLDPNDVYERELQGANRVSLLDALDVDIDDSDLDEAGADDSPDTSTGDDPHEEVVPDTSTPNDGSDE